MTLIDLKFSPEMARAVLEGRKCCMSRRTPKGVPGDEFEIQGVRFRLLDVIVLTCDQVCLGWFRCEGFGNSIGFVTLIDRIYPDLKPDDILAVHFFARCP